MQVGCFELELLSGGETLSVAGRWRCTNNVTGISHVTYGTQQEVEEQARQQTEAWDRKKSGIKPLGSAWRDWSKKNAADKASR